MIALANPEQVLCEMVRVTRTKEHISNVRTDGGKVRGDSDITQLPSVQAPKRMLLILCGLVNSQKNTIWLFILTCLSLFGLGYHVQIVLRLNCGKENENMLFIYN